MSAIFFFYDHGSVHLESMSIIVQLDANIQFIIFLQTVCSLQKYNKLYIVASYWTITDIDVSNTTHSYRRK